MFAPGVTAGLLKPADLAGYRKAQVYIRQSMHVPLNREAVRDAMPAFFDLLRDETDPAVRVVLGHFVFVCIHPYMDGNGRIGRFLMNLMMAAGGYPWTVIPVADRRIYMDALEKASVGEDIGPFADLLARRVKKGLAGAPLPEVPGTPSGGTGASDNEDCPRRLIPQMRRVLARHSYRSWLDQTEAPMGVQRELMRHASIQTTMNVYGRAMTDSKRQAHNNVVQMVLKPQPGKAVLDTEKEEAVAKVV